jgi:CubicO group peptidase (beta-lactamase class C family)
MYLRKLLIFLIILVSLYNFQVLFAGTTQHNKINKHIQAYHDYGQFSGTILVVKDGTEIYSNSFGYSDYPQKTLNNANTEFYIASVTKQFTAYAILLLAHNHKLNLNDHIGEYIEDLPPHIHYLTIHQIVNHTSGLPDYFSAGLFKPGLENADVIEWLLKQDLKYSPGTTFHYSNPGYILLAQLIESLSGKSYTNFMKENIFLPNNLMNTYVFDDNYITSTNKAIAYDHQDEIYDYSLRTYGAGGIYSTTPDLYKWHLHLLDQTEIPDSLFTLMFTPTRLKDDSFVHVGYGWAILQDYPGYVISNGSLSGFHSTFIRNLKKDTAIILLTNKTCEKTEKIGLEILDIMHGIEVDHPKSPRKYVECNVSNDILMSYCGNYYFDDYAIQISLKDGKLMYQEPGMRENVLYAEDDSHFFMKSFNIQCEFKVPEKQQILKIDSNGIIYEGIKSNDNP